MAKTIKELYEKNPNTFEEKTLSQILAFTGNGKLSDNNDTSIQFRELINYLPKISQLELFINECLTEANKNLHRALQDLINEVGIRLGFNVEFGLYQGRVNCIGYDGLWKSNEHTIIVESKTTDAFSINLDKIANYRKKLSEQGKVTDETSSILLVVGREDTGNLEAQIRGSKHAWDIRLISTESLLKLLKIKMDFVNDLNIFNQISEILKPREFTRLDYLVEIIFKTGEEANEVISITNGELGITQNEENETFRTPVNFNSICIENIEKYLNLKLKKQSKILYDNKDKNIAIICPVSKNHRTEEKPSYWFAFHNHQKFLLENYKNAFVAFGCGDETLIFIFEFKEFISYINNMNFTERDNKKHWHVFISKRDEKFYLLLKNNNNVDITNKKIYIS